MPARTDATPFLPHTPDPDLPELSEAVQGCRGCELYQDATHAVFGEGRRGAPLMLVGEQPGDAEDRAGRPFIGPAGRLLDRALAEAGIDRERAYVTNAVKHFRFKSTAGSTRRIHATPGAGHIRACAPWLRAELGAVEPDVVVALGATAAQALMGPSFRVTQQRGLLLDWPPEAGPYAGVQTRTHLLLATIHPSAVLRADPQTREEAFAGLVADLRVAAQALPAA
ncbi:UdgX family uracil-DNA binding protein [Nakamurella endophytica]|uniref:Type-4 uracil-DNA glycosylase n=1 Tax=Nakamurella endophytica TaxID=1748367 RepID=A0A917T370_9ACTN|nr:UdgX family uracil-DNA binding protein [Nakamurella endophytica]GGM08588.1 uracil-DNA glycosylase [Nakamurella endophytica]